MIEYEIRSFRRGTMVGFKAESVQRCGRFTDRDRARRVAENIFHNDGVYKTEVWELDGTKREVLVYRRRPQPSA